MAKIDSFELPRDDWYDEEGRLYKDVIVENLNALENKLIELSGINITNIPLPDISTIEYPDTDLSSDEDSIVNLKSFLNITNTVNYPTEYSFSGNTLQSLTYWGEDYKRHQLKNIIVDASDSKPYVVFDPDNINVFATDTFTEGERTEVTRNYTVIGNPTITDDAIITGLSANNYISIPTSLAPTDSFTINTGVAIPNEIVQSGGSNSIIFAAKGDADRSQVLQLTMFSNRISIYRAVNGEQTWLDEIGGITIAIGDRINIIIDYTPGQMSFNLYRNGQLIANKTIAYTLNDTITQILIGRNSIGAFYLNGTYDLNSFYITKGGVTTRAVEREIIKNYLIGYYTDNKIIDLNSSLYGDLNILYLLANMKRVGTYYTLYNGGTRDADGGYTARGQVESRGLVVGRRDFRYKKGD